MADYRDYDGESRQKDIETQGAIRRAVRALWTYGAGSSGQPVILAPNDLRLVLDALPKKYRKLVEER